MHVFCLLSAPKQTQTQNSGSRERPASPEQLGISRCMSLRGLIRAADALMDTMRLPAHSAVAFLLFLLAGTCSAQGLTQTIYKSPSGESVQFLGDSVSLKYFPAASANCSQCYLSFKLGALSELDAVSFVPFQMAECAVVQPASVSAKAMMPSPSKSE